MNRDAGQCGYLHQLSIFDQWKTLFTTKSVWDPQWHRQSPIGDNRCRNWPFLCSCTLFTTIFSLIVLQLHKGPFFAPTEQHLFIKTTRRNHNNPPLLSYTSFWLWLLWEILTIQSHNIWLLALRQLGFSGLRRAHHSRIKYGCLNSNNIMCLYNFVWKPSCHSWTVRSIQSSQCGKAISPTYFAKLIYCNQQELDSLGGSVSHETNWSTGEWLLIETNVTSVSQRISTREAPSYNLFLSFFQNALTSACAH